MTDTKDSFCTIDYYGKIGRGKSKHRPRNDAVLFGGKYPFIQTGDVKHANFYITNYSETYNEVGLAQSKLWQPGTLCITIAANIADTAILKIPACFPDSIIGFLPYRDKSETIFVKYCLDTLKLQIESISRGTTQDNLSVEKLRTIKFKRIALPIQRKIAAILSAYDELIENNNRRIAILEKMAEEIYREWFVRLRFPGHKKVKVVKGVPEGWEVKESEEVFSFVKGLSYKSDEISDEKGEHYFITLKSFNRGGGYRSNGLKYYTGKFNARQIVRPYDIVMAVTDMTQDRAVVGRIARVPETGIDQYLISTDVIKIVPKTVSADFLYAAIRFSGFSEMLKEFANGANVLHLNTTAMKRLKMLIPTNDLIQTFTQRLRPIFELSDNLASKNTILKSTRDLLLPRLISGKLDVEHLDIAFPPGMDEERS